MGQREVCFSWLLMGDCKGIDCWIFCKGIDCWIFIKKGKAEIPMYIGSLTATNENNHENVHVGTKKGKRCNFHCIQQMRKKLYMGVNLAMYTCLKMVAMLPTITNDIKLLINFFDTSLDISPKLFMSIVRLIWHSYKSYLDCYLNSLTHAL